MKKTFVYIAVLAVLIGLAIFLYFKNQAPSIEDQKAFTTPEMGELTQINMKDRHGHEVVLTKEGNAWMVNGQYPASSIMLNDMFYALEFMYPEYPVPAVAVENVLTEMITNSTKVSLYKNGQSKPFKVFTVGGASHAQDGSFMLMEVDGKAADKPYLVKLPGFKGYLSYRFSAIKKHWVSPNFTSYLPEEIKSVSIQYFQEDADQSFVLFKENGKFSLESADGTISEPFNEGLADAIFAAFMDLSFEEFVDSIPNESVLRSDFHYLDLSLVLIDGTTEKLSVYFKPLSIDEQVNIDENGNPITLDRGKLYAFHHKTSSFFTIQYYTFGKLFIKAEQLKN